MEQSLFALVTTDPGFYRPTPAWGQSRHSDPASLSSALPSASDILGACLHVSKVPNSRHYSMNSKTRISPPWSPSTSHSSKPSGLKRLRRAYLCHES